MSLQDILDSYKQESDDNRSGSIHWSESASFKENAVTVFRGIIHPAVGGLMKVFINSGYICLPLQKLHAVKHVPESEHVFFSVDAGRNTMQLDFYADHLMERFKIDAFFSNCESRSIDYSVSEISASGIENIVEDFTEYFLKHQ